MELAAKLGMDSDNETLVAATQLLEGILACRDIAVAAVCATEEAEKATEAQKSTTSSCWTCRSSCESILASRP